MKSGIDNAEPNSGRKNREKRFSKRLTVSVIIALVVALVSAVAVVFAWLAARSSATVNVTVGGFEIKPYVYNGEEWIEMDSAGTASRFDPYASNGNPKINLKKLGYGHCYIRVKVFETIYDADGNPAPVSNVPIVYSFDAAEWRYNSTDGYYYYKHIIEDPTPDGESGIPFINGIVSPTDDPDRDDTINCCVSLIIESVQPDRVSAFFGAEIVPWIELPEDDFGDVTVDTDDELILDD